MGKVIASGVSVSTGFNADAGSIKVCAEPTIGYDLEPVHRFPECEITVVYEAGALGFALARHLEGRGVCVSVDAATRPR